ncbi:MAG: hypothetical protein KatS3mg054_0095 [Chloroflexus sp.]|nr:MAG: hypothetical protein KatS3mg054_0095 [Chloroflexus sp.]
MLSGRNQDLPELYSEELFKFFEPAVHITAGRIRIAECKNSEHKKYIDFICNVRLMSMFSIQFIKCLAKCGIIKRGRVFPKRSEYGIRFVLVADQTFQLRNAVSIKRGLGDISDYVSNLVRTRGEWIGKDEKCLCRGMAVALCRYVTTSNARLRARLAKRIISYGIMSFKLPQHHALAVNPETEFSKCVDIKFRLGRAPIMRLRYRSMITPLESGLRYIQLENLLNRGRNASSQSP